MKNSEANRNNKTYFVKTIIEWGEKNLLDYPWREVDSPFQVLLGELLLRKTASEQVCSVFTKLINEYPTPNSFLKEDPEYIKSIIKELGLSNTRTRQIVKICEIITNQHHRKIPSTYSELIDLPGIGKYTANSILCFGFGKQKAILDTNVIRILTRFFEIESEKSRPRNDKELWSFAEELVPKLDPQLYNYSLLDFGKLICKSEKPKCGECPLKDKCKCWNKLL